MRIVLTGLALTFTLGSGLLAASGAEAQIVYADVAKNLEYQQTGPSTVTSVGGFFSARAFFNTPADFDGGYVTFAGPASPQSFNITGAINCCGGTRQGRGYQTQYLPVSTLNTDYPTGIDYALTATNSATSASQTVTIPYTQDLYTTDIPALTAASYSALQGVNAASGLTVDFNSFTPNANAAVAQSFFTIYDLTTGQVAYTANDLAPTTTSVTFTPGTLTSGDQYKFELIFDDKITGESGSVQTAYYSDVRTYGLFTTSSAPEPATWVLTILGVAGVGGAIRLRRRGVRIAAAA